MVFGLVLTIYRNGLLLLLVGLGGVGVVSLAECKKRGASRRTLGRRSYPQTGLLKKVTSNRISVVRELPSVAVLVEGFCQGGPAVGALAKSPSHHPYFDL